jgi:hypothetical protein
MIDSRDLWQIKGIGTMLAINLGERIMLKFADHRMVGRRAYIVPC